MVAFSNSQTADDGRLKQSNFKNTIIEILSKIVSIKDSF